MTEQLTLSLSHQDIKEWACHVGGQVWGQYSQKKHDQFHTLTVRCFRLGWFPRSHCCSSLQPHGLWAARLLCPWDSPGKSILVSCHFFLQRGPKELDMTEWLIFFIYCYIFSSIYFRMCSSSPLGDAERLHQSTQMAVSSCLSEVSRAQSSQYRHQKSVAPSWFSTP